MANLKVSFAVDGQRLIVRPEGLINVMVRDDFYDQVIQQISTSGINNLVIDLSKVSGLDSSALGAIFSLYKHLLQDEGSLCLLQPSESVADLIRLTHLEKVIPVKENLAELPELESSL
ncbi:MAG: STAS domain-containing protein [Deltaproteobacteria bacterium]|nr:STAS domain-containing protein [Candidatus Tharpellaceae bacterium]